jgi:hypothetical protein
MSIQYKVQPFQRRDKQQSDKDIQMLLLACVSTVLYIFTLWNAEKSLASSVYRDERAGSFSPSQGHIGWTGLKNVRVPSIQCVKKTKKCAQFPSVFRAPT